ICSFSWAPRLGARAILSTYLRPEYPEHVTGADSYGRLCKPDHPPINEEEGEMYLRQDLRTALTATLRYCPVLAAEPEGRIAAIVDFTFNLGAGRLQTSTLRRRVNQRDWHAAGKELRRWIYGGGKILPGLVARREAEVMLLI